MSLLALYSRVRGTVWKQPRTLQCFMRQVHSSGSGPFARSVDADHVPKVLRKFARPGDRHYFYVIDNNGRLYLESTPRRNIATCIREKSFLSFFYDRLLPSHEWWRRRKLTSSKTRRPVSATDYVTNSAVLSTTATSQDSVTDSDEDDMTVDEELSNFLRKYSYVSVCGVESNWISPYTTPVVYTDIVLATSPRELFPRKKGPSSSPLASSSLSSSSSSSSSPSPSSHSSHPHPHAYYLVWGGETHRRLLNPNSLTMDEQGRVFHPSPEALTAMQAAKTPEDVSSLTSDPSFASLVSHDLVDRLLRGEFASLGRTSISDYPDNPAEHAVCDDPATTSFILGGKAYSFGTQTNGS